MNNRQRGALEHPVPYSQRGERAHKNRVENLGNKLTILTVNEHMPGVWIWQASLSYQRPFGAGPVAPREWTASMARKADLELRRMLDGVGEEVVFAIRPSHVDLPGFEELVALDVINDGDATARVAKSMLDMMPGPPRQFTAMHVWKSLTLAEVEEALAHAPADAPPSRAAVERALDMMIGYYLGRVFKVGDSRIVFGTEDRVEIETALRIDLWNVAGVHEDEAASVEQMQTMIEFLRALVREIDDEEKAKVKA